MSVKANQANQLKNSAFRSTLSSGDLRPGLYLLIRYSKGSIMVVVKRGSETIMAVKEKKRVQVKIDKDLADNTEAVLNELGLNPTTAINMFYKRIVAEAALPFKPALSEAERANLRFLKATEGTPVTELKDAKGVSDWLNDPDED